HRFAGYILQLDRAVLEHMTEPGAVVLAHAPDKPSWGAVGAAMLVKPRKAVEQRVDERSPESRRGPLFELAEIDLESNDGEVRVERRADEDAAIGDEHPVWQPGKPYRARNR